MYLKGLIQRIVSPENHSMLSQQNCLAPTGQGYSLEIVAVQMNVQMIKSHFTVPEK